jgi:hypothetical protein
VGGSGKPGPSPALCCQRGDEMRKFMSFVFRVISSYPQVTKHLTEESKQKFAFEADKYPVVGYDFSTHRQFVNEI